MGIGFCTSRLLSRLERVSQAEFCPKGAEFGMIGEYAAIW